MAIHIRLHCYVVLSCGKDIVDCSHDSVCTDSVDPNTPSYSDSTRISGMIVQITWHTWFPDSFSLFILSKCSDSLQSVCFELSKRNQRHVSTWNKCYCEMSPAAHDMMNYNHMLISGSCSNGMFTRRSIANLLGLFSHIQIRILEQRGVQYRLQY